MNELEQKILKEVLRKIEENDTNYHYRYRLVLHALYLATVCGMQAGLRIDSRAEEGFRVVAAIELPTGQVSWHMPEHPYEWDGHSTPEKYERCHDFRNAWP